MDTFILAYRGVACRKAYPAIVTQQYTRLDEDTCRFIKFFAKKWKAMSIFQVLLQYRAARYYDMFNLSQQVINPLIIQYVHRSNYGILGAFVQSECGPFVTKGE